MTHTIHNRLKSLPCSIYHSCHRIHTDWYALFVLAGVLGVLGAYTMVSG